MWKMNDNESCYISHIVTKKLWFMKEQKMFIVYSFLIVFQNKCFQFYLIKNTFKCVEMRKTY